MLNFESKHFYCRIRRLDNSRGGVNLDLRNNPDMRQSQYSWNKLVSPNSKTMRSKTNSYRGFNDQYTDLVIPSNYGQKQGSSWVTAKTGKENVGFGKSQAKQEESRWRSRGEEETVKEEEAIYSTIRTRCNLNIG